MIDWFIVHFSRVGPSSGGNGSTAEEREREKDSQPHLVGSAMRLLFHQPSGKVLVESVVVT